MASTVSGEQTVGTFPNNATSYNAWCNQYNQWHTGNASLACGTAGVDYFDPDERVFNLEDETVQTLGEVAQQNGGQLTIRRYNPQDDSGQATNGNQTVTVSVEDFVSFNSPYCFVADLFGCAEVSIQFFLDNLLKLALTMGVNFQSEKKVVTRNGNSHTENAADSATLYYTGQCLQAAATYLNALNNTNTFNSFVSTNPTDPQLPCSFTTQHFKQMYGMVTTSNLPLSTCVLFQQMMNNIMQQCAIEGSKEAAKLYALFALTALVVLPIAYGCYRAGGPAKIASSVRHRLCGSAGRHVQNDHFEPSSQTAAY